MAEKNKGTQSGNGISRNAGISASTRNSHSAPDSRVSSGQSSGVSEHTSHGHSTGESAQQGLGDGAGVKAAGKLSEASILPNSSSGSSKSASSDDARAKTPHPDMGATSEQLRTYDVKGDVTRQVTEVSVVDKNGYERVDVTQSEHTSKEGMLRKGDSAAQSDSASIPMSADISARTERVIPSVGSESTNGANTFDGMARSRDTLAPESYSQNIDTGDVHHSSTMATSKSLPQSEEVDGVTQSHSQSLSESQTTDLVRGETVRETSNFVEDKVSEQVSDGVTHSVAHTRSGYQAENLETGEVHQRSDEKIIDNSTEPRVVDGNVYSSTDMTVDNISTSSSVSKAHSEGVGSSMAEHADGAGLASHGASAGHSATENVGKSASVSHSESAGHSTPENVGDSASVSHSESAGHSATENVGKSASVSHSESAGHTVGESANSSVSSSHGVSAGHSVTESASSSVSTAPGESASRSEAEQHSSAREASASLQNVAGAIEQHLATHSETGSGADLAAQAGSLASSALEALGERKERGADLGQESFDLSSGKVEPSSATGPHGVSLETLDFVAQRGLSPNGMHELISSLGPEVQGQSHLQLADRVGVNEVSEMGEKGFPGDKVAAIQEVASGLGAAAGTKDMALTKLEGLELLKEIEAPENAGGVFFADAKGGQGLALGVMSKDDFAKSPSAVGADVFEVKSSLSDLASAHEVGKSLDQVSKAEKPSESSHQAEAQMVMAMS